MFWPTNDLINNLYSFKWSDSIAVWTQITADYSNHFYDNFLKVEKPMGLAKLKFDNNFKQLCVDKFLEEVKYYKKNEDT